MFNDRFRQLVHRFVARDLARNWIRTTLTVAGIALGVAVMLAINLANSTALSRFEESIDLVAGKSNLELVPRTGTEMDEQVLASLRFLWERRVKFTPVIDESGVVGKDDLVELLGVDMFADPAFRPFTIAKNADDDQTSIFNSDAVYVGSKFAERHHLKRGDHFHILLNDRAVELQVVGVIAYEGSGKAFGGNLLVMDIGSAQQALNMPGKISRVDMICDEAQLPHVQAAVQQVVPASLSVERPQRRTAQVQKMIASFQYNLAALSLIALLVGMFLIYNTMSMTVIRKRTEIGILRALGAGRTMVFALFTVQALVMGVLGSGIGLALGYLFSRGAVKAVGSTVQALYVDQPAADVFVDPGVMVFAFCGGIAISLIAALGPVWEAISVQPAEATRRASYELRVVRNAKLLSVIGLALLACAWIAAQAPAVAGFPVFGYVSAALTIFGVALILPIVLGAMISSTRSVMQSIFGSEGKLAVLGLGGTLGRTAVTVASLMLGIAMMISLAIMVGSFRQTVIVWVNQTLKADLYVAPQTRAQSNKGRIASDVVARIKAVPGIEASDSFVEMPIEYNGAVTNLGAGELDVLQKFGRLLFVHGSSDQVFAELRKGDACVVSESFALRNNVHEGEAIGVQAPNTVLRLKIAGIYYDYASDLGYIILPRDVYSKYFPDYYSTSIAVFAQPGVDVDELRQRVLSAAGSQTRLNVRSNRELRNEVLRIFDNTFAITYALHAIAILVAILGVMNALFALTYEMRREFAILAYIGASLKQLRKIVLIQAGLLGLVGNLVGVAVGLVLSLLLINVINKQSFGWTVQLSIPFDFILESSALVLTFALLSGVLPAQIAVRNISPEAVRYE